MHRKCRLTGQSFEVSQFEQEYCKRWELPLPDVSPVERLRLLTAYRSAHYLFPAVCAQSGKRMLSAVSPKCGYIVQDVDLWLSDRSGSRSSGRDYDFSRTFFEQFSDLMHSVPLPSLSCSHANLENSDYCNFVSAAKSCYLVFSGTDIQDCYYGRFIYQSRDLIDCFYARDCELCYHCQNIQGCYQIAFSEHCSGCSDSIFLSGCRSCKNCYGCVNLANKEYYWYNDALTAQEWRRRREACALVDASVLALEVERFQSFSGSHPVRYLRGNRHEDSTGNFLNETKACHDCLLVSQSENLEHCLWTFKTRDALFVAGFGNNSELLYNSLGVGGSAYNIKFSAQCRNGVRDLEYCYLVENNSKDCFGCVGLHNAECCILNKQYNRSSYLEMLPRVKAHMRATGEYGQFFPPALSPCAYNQSDAQFFFPLNRERALELGYYWEDEAATLGDSVNEPPKTLPQTDSEVLDKVFRCSLTGRGFKYQRKELEYLRRAGLGLPQASPFERIRRAAEFLQWKPTKRLKCAKCAEECSSSFDSTNILCEKCYQALLES